MDHFFNATPTQQPVHLTGDRRSDRIDGAAVWLLVDGSLDSNEQFIPALGRWSNGSLSNDESGEITSLIAYLAEIPQLDGQRGRYRFRTTVPIQV